ACEGVPTGHAEHHVVGVKVGRRTLMIFGKGGRVPLQNVRGGRVHLISQSARHLIKTKNTLPAALACRPRATPYDLRTRTADVAASRSTWRRIWRRPDLVGVSVSVCGLRRLSVSQRSASLLCDSRATWRLWPLDGSDGLRTSGLSVLSHDEPCFRNHA